MRASWLIAIAAGAAISASAPTELLAQGNSNRAQQRQQRQEAREQGRRQAERAQLQRQREQQRRQQATQVRVPRYDDRYERSRRNDRDWRYDRYNDRYSDRRDDRRYDDRYDRRGPAFCRSGEGHPVFGRQWCRNKGFGLGREGYRDIWGDIIYRQPRDRRYYDDRRLSHNVLVDILGAGVLGRFNDYGRTYYGSQGSVNGRWLDSRSIMELYMGTIPIARLIDLNRDGRVDDVILSR